MDEWLGMAGLLWMMLSSNGWQWYGIAWNEVVEDLNVHQPNDEINKIKINFYQKMVKKKNAGSKFLYTHYYYYISGDIVIVVFIFLDEKK